MQKDSWLTFISDQVRHQNSLEGMKKIQSWALGILALTTLSMGISAVVVSSQGPTFLYLSKVVFAALMHLFLALGLYLPALLQKGEKTSSRILGIRDFTSLIFVALALTFVTYLCFAVSRQAISIGHDANASAFFIFTTWVNTITSGIYLSGLLFYFAGLFFFPKAVTRVLENTGKHPIPLLAIHAVAFVLNVMSYSQVVEIGAAPFFEQFRTAALFWIFCSSLIFMIGRMLNESVVGALTSLELEVASGKLERPEDILARYKQAFTSKRLSQWLSQISRQVASKAHEINQFLHQSVQVIELQKPTESQLGQMEDRYKKAHQLCLKLDKEYQRFALNVSFFYLSDTEREKLEEVRDQYSREIRHAKLELSSVRKRIDDKLVALKESERQEISEIPVEPVSL